MKPYSILTGGIYCGVSGYTCAVASDSDAKKVDSLKKEDDKRRKELAKFLFGGLAEPKH